MWMRLYVNGGLRSLVFRWPWQGVANGFKLLAVRCFIKRAISQCCVTVYASVFNWANFFFFLFHYELVRRLKGNTCVGCLHLSFPFYFCFAQSCHDPCHIKNNPSPRTIFYDYFLFISSILPVLVFEFVEFRTAGLPALSQFGKGLRAKPRLRLDSALWRPLGN